MAPRPETEMMPPKETDGPTDSDELTVEGGPAKEWMQPFDTANPIPERPHMPEEAVFWLENQLRNAKCFLEYGAGGSTRLAASLNVPRIISVESDRGFAELLRKVVDASGSTSKFDLIFADIGPTRSWGFPLNFQGFRRWPDYTLGAWDHLRQQDLQPDLILIDGRFRLACFLASLLEAAPGTMIAFDDYSDRKENYGYAETFLAPQQVIDRCGIFRVPKMLPRRAIARALARTICLPE